MTAASDLVGRTLSDAGLGETFGVRVIGVHRRERHIVNPPGDVVLRAGDALVVAGVAAERDRLLALEGVVSASMSEREYQRWLWESGAATALVHPESGLIGQSVRESRLRSSHGVHVLGVRHGQEAVEDFQDAKLHAGDRLLLVGPWKRIDQLREQTHEFVLMEMPRERGEVVEAYRKMPLALAILAGMVLLTLLNIVPLTAAVLMAALAAVLTRCLTMEDAYESIHWSSIVLIAGLLPLADALAVTGGTDFIVDGMMSVFGDLGPRVVLSVVFFLTAGIGLFLSNTAAAILVAPIAIDAAERVGVSPYPMAVAVVFGASAAFVTPVSSPVVTLVVEPGRYRFIDFVRVGVPMLILTWLVVVLLTPILFPFDAGWPGPVGP